MALIARDIPITRDDVLRWIQLWQKSAKKNRPVLRDFISKQIDDLHLPDRHVITAGHDYLGESTDVLILILDDLPSYGIDGDAK
jgi:hypothetical protein